jgi:hypothetical protein
MVTLFKGNNYLNGGVAEMVDCDGFENHLGVKNLRRFESFRLRLLDGKP